MEVCSFVMLDVSIVWTLSWLFLSTTYISISDSFWLLSFKIQWDTRTVSFAQIPSVNTRKVFPSQLTQPSALYCYDKEQYLAFTMQIVTTRWLLPCHISWMKYHNFQLQELGNGRQGEASKGMKSINKYHRWKGHWGARVSLLPDILSLSKAKETVRKVSSQLQTTGQTSRKRISGAVFALFLLSMPTSPSVFLHPARLVPAQPCWRDTHAETDCKDTKLPGCLRHLSSMFQGRCHAKQACEPWAHQTNPAGSLQNIWYC